MDSSASSHGGYLPKPDVLLNGQNYKAWSSTMRLHLRGLKLWGHVDGSRPAPPHPAISSEMSPGSVDSTGDSSFQAWAKWQDDDSRAVAIIGQSCEMAIRLAICEFPTAKVIWDHLSDLYQPSSQALHYSLLQSLATIYQRDRSVQEFFAEITALWRQVDEMAPSHCVSCSHCVATAQYRDSSRVYEFLMRLRPDFEAVRSQFLHRQTPPTFRDTLSTIFAEETRLCTMEEEPSHLTFPHAVLTAPQFPP